ncbi:MAG: ATP synthase subunit I [Synechococcaceae cyanobacterium]|nr:ATP synthase subunit I [Synechococcaceae cyanobacterium]
MQAVPSTSPDADPTPVSTPEEPEPSSSPESLPSDGMDSYFRLQRRLLLATLIAALVAVPLASGLFGPSAAFSLMVGSLAGLLYLRLLSRSVTRLGVDTRSVGKAQLLVPLVLLLAAARFPQLEVLPALLGFLLYKPALLVQAFLDA